MTLKNNKQYIESLFVCMSVLGFELKNNYAFKYYLEVSNFRLERLLD